MKIKFKTVMLINTTNINKTINHLSPQTIAYKTHGIWHGTGTKMWRGHYMI